MSVNLSHIIILFLLFGIISCGGEMIHTIDRDTYVDEHERLSCTIHKEPMAEIKVFELNQTSRGPALYITPSDQYMIHQGDYPNSFSIAASLHPKKYYQTPAIHKVCLSCEYEMRNALEGQSHILKDFLNRTKFEEANFNNPEVSEAFDYIEARLNQLNPANEIEVIKIRRPLELPSNPKPINFRARELSARETLDKFADLIDCTVQIGEDEIIFKNKISK